MAQTPPPAITPAPTPAPQRGDRATFSSRVDAFVTWISAAVAQFAAVATNVYGNATDAYNSASIAESAADTAIAATGATLFNPATNYVKGQAAISGIDFQAYRRKTAGISATDPSADAANWALISAGLWGAPIASAATLNLSAAYDFRHVTGTTTITAITIPLGAARTVIFDGILTLTNGAGLSLPGAANILTAAGDRMIVRGDTAGAVVVSYNPASGRAIRGTVDLIASATVGAAVANIDFVSLFTSDYSKYVIEFEAVHPSTDASLLMQLMTGGTPDTASNYNVIGFDATPANLTAVSAITLTGTSVATINAAGATGVVELRGFAIGAVGTRGGVVMAVHRTTTSQIDRATNTSFTYAGSSTANGFRLYFSTGNLDAGTIRVYGHRKT